ncbi:MAG: M28 family peptidase [Thermoguttaceae bacterium]
MIRRYRLPTITWLTFAALLAGVLVTGAVGGAERSSSYTAALESIHAEELAGHVNYLASDALEGRGAGTRGGRAAGDYLAKQYAKLHLRGAGPDGGYFQPFAAACRNVLAMLPGRDPELKKQYVLVCAHYDHLGDGTHGRSLGIVGPIHPGADDNASGTAGVLELAHAMRLAPALKRSLLFASWDSEEEGMLGSKHWLAQPTVPLESLTIVLNLDMIGRLRGEHLAVLGSRTAYGLRRLVCQENEGSRLLLEFDWTLIANSDHHPFYERGIPVLLLHTGLHADYHRPSDTAEKINSQGMCEVDRLLFALVYELANRPEPPRFRAAARGETEETRRRLVEPVPLAELLDGTPLRLGISWRVDDAEPGTIVVSQVVPESLAARAGLQIGDRIYEIGGRRFADDAIFLRWAKSLPEPIELLIERDGQLRVLTLRHAAAAPPAKRAA